jgi:D-aminopeptidase
MRAGELGIKVGDLSPGPHDAITDVDGVRVGHSTILRGEGPLVVGEGPVRTGVTVICPRAGLARDEPVFAGSHTFNGNGEMTGRDGITAYGLTPESLLGALNEVRRDSR